jgi:hypothetical protein
MCHAGNSRHAAEPIRLVQGAADRRHTILHGLTPLRSGDYFPIPRCCPRCRHRSFDGKWLSLRQYTPSSDTTVIQCESHDSHETTRMPDIRLCVFVSCGQASTATSTSMHFRERQRYWCYKHIRLIQFHVLHQVHARIAARSACGEQKCRYSLASVEKGARHLMSQHRQINVAVPFQLVKIYLKLSASVIIHWRATRCAASVTGRQAKNRQSTRACCPA